MENNLWQDLYRKHTDRYDRLVQAEDYQGNLIAALRALHPIENCEVIELGAGTGRITEQLCPYVKHICAFDLAPAMIHLAHRKLRHSSSLNCLLMNADSRAVPLLSNSADLVIEGCSFIQIMAWQWQFSTMWIRTDYCFSTTDVLYKVVTPVFGETMLERTSISEAGIILPECTGIWWRFV